MLSRSLLALLLAVPAFAQVRVVELAAPPVALSAGAAFAPAPSVALQGMPLLAAPSLPQAPLLATVPSRTAVILRDDADRLYASLASIHSQAKAGVPEKALADLKKAFAGDFDGVAAGLGVPETGAELRARVKVLRAARSKAQKTLEKAPSERRAEASQAFSAVSGELAAAQLKAARELLTTKSPVGPKAFKRNAALWSLVGAHNSAADAAAEAAYVEALRRGEEAFGDGRPYLYWSRWRNLESELEDAARDARNRREAKASETLEDLAAVLRGTGDAADAAAAAALETAAASPSSAAILAALPLIKHPSIKTRGPVAYADMDAKTRAQVHALESARADWLETAAAETALRRAAALLSSPRPSPADKRLAATLAASAHGWAARGRVDAKKLAASNLDAASLALVRGDLALAARHLSWAADALEARRAELVRIALSVRRRLLAPRA